MNEASNNFTQVSIFFIPIEDPSRSESSPNFDDRPIGCYVHYLHRTDVQLFY